MIIFKIIGGLLLFAYGSIIILWLAVAVYSIYKSIKGVN